MLSHVTLLRRPINRLFALWGESFFLRRNQHLLLRSRAFIFIFLSASPIAAFGQASVSAGIAVPVAPDQLADLYNPGFGLSGSFPLPIRALMVQPRLTAGFDILQVDAGFLEERGEELGSEIDGGNLSIIHVGFDVQIIRPNAAVKPYVAPFFGFAIIAVENFSISGISYGGGEGETAVAIGGAAGVAIRLPVGPHVFAEGRLMHAFTEDNGTTWAPLRAGVAFDLD